MIYDLRKFKRRLEKFKKNLATLNVSSLEAGALKDLVRETKKYKVSVIALQSELEIVGS